MIANGWRARIVRRFPHDPEAFTQGLLWHDGRLFESVGGYGRSEVREVELETGRVLRRASLPPASFGEGLAERDGELLSLTWRDEIAFRWSLADLAALGTVPLAGESWGLSGERSSLVVSDGSPRLRFFDRDSLAERRNVAVTAGGRPVAGLNELQCVRGEILANILGWRLIARIEPESGAVTGWVDLSALVADSGGGDPAKMANGIAWNPESDRLLLTGKNWPWLYQVELEPLRRADAPTG